MSHLDANRNIVRVAILALLIISLLGPWMFDLINVPAEYPCDEPFVRLEGDFCGYPLSGFFALYMFSSGLFHSLVRLVSGTFTGQAREFLMGLYLLPILPFLTTVLLIWKKETPSLRTINLVAWILALIPTLTIFIFQIKDQAFRLWGPWLYILAAVSAVIVEILIRVGERKPIN